MLAQFDFDNWIEIVVAVLLVGGSIIAALTKKLTEVFTPKKPDQPPGAPTDLASEQRHPPRPRQVHPARPVARPMPRVAQPYLSSPVAPRPMAVETVRRLAPRPGDVSRRPSTEGERGSPWPEPPTFGTDFPVGQEDRLESLPHVQPPQRPVSPKPRRKGRPSPSARRKEPEPAGPKARPGRLESGLEAATGPAQPHELITAIERPTRSALRYAIVMSEVLGPPLALRPPE